jgi:methionyl-tRNA formyltransferase
MLMEAKMDAGPIIAQARIEIAPEDWPPKGLMLSQMLFVEGANLLAEVLPQWLGGEIAPEPQDESAATYTKKFSDQDAQLDISRFRLDKNYQREAFLKIRAFDHPPAGGPRAHFFMPNGKRIIVTDAEFKDGELKILKVIPEGKKEMPYEDFKNGYGGRA